MPTEVPCAYAQHPDARSSPGPHTARSTRASTSAGAAAHGSAATTADTNDCARSTQRKSNEAKQFDAFAADSESNTQAISILDTRTIEHDTADPNTRAATVKPLALNRISLNERSNPRGGGSNRRSTWTAGEGAKVRAGFKVFPLDSINPFFFIAP